MQRTVGLVATCVALSCVLVLLESCSSSSNGAEQGSDAGSAGVSGVGAGVAGTSAASGVAGAAAGGASGASGSGAGVAGSAQGGAGAGGQAAGGNGSAGTSGAGTSGAGTSGAGGTGASSAGASGAAGNGASGSGAGGMSGAAGKGGAGGGGGGGVSGASGSAGSGGTLPNITLWIAGDSTVATGGPCPIGWGGQFAPHFTSQVTVKNNAVAGRSVRTWLYDVQSTMDSSGECTLGLDAMGQPTIQARWTAMLASTGMKAGDYLFIQFGINDGDGTCPRHVGLNAFKSTYGMMAQAAKDRGAHPIFVTPVSAIKCSGGNAVGTRGSYVTATQDAGAQYGVPVIDLHALSVALYNARGFCPLPAGNTDISATTGGDVGAFFCDDHTHFDTPGAQAISDLMAKALKDQGIGLAAYLK